MRTITLRELEEAQSSSAPPLLLEALPHNYFEADHIPGARNLPLDDIDKLAGSLIPSVDTPVVTYCAGPSCPNSAMAARRLEELGYTNVAAYEGGKEEWAAAGLPFEQGSTEAAA
jgi:rhodanese-related sulfurtransferase